LISRGEGKPQAVYTVFLVSRIELIGRTAHAVCRLPGFRTAGHLRVTLLPMTRKLKGAVAITTIALVAAWVKRKWARQSTSAGDGDVPVEHSFLQADDDYLAEIIFRAKPALEKAYGLET
jgi:hypothetical protein